MSEINRWKLSDEVKEKYMPIIKEHIEKIRNCNLEETSRFDVELDLSDTELNPYTLGAMLKDLGYEEDSIDDNGWEMDFWIYYCKKNNPDLCIRGTGIISEFFLSGMDDDEGEYNDVDDESENEDEYAIFDNECKGVVWGE